MPSENDLRDFFASTDAPNRLSTGRVIARSRRRRLPRQIAAGAAGLLAMAGVGALAINVTLPPGANPTADQATLSERSTDSLDDSMESQLDKQVVPEEVPTCGATVTEPAASTSGLELEIEFDATASLDSARIEGIVRLRNITDESVRGITAMSPSMALALDGRVVWASNPVQYSVGMGVDLEPGESLEYAASFAPVSCDPTADPTANTGSAVEGDTFLDPGDYALSAFMSFTPQDDTGYDVEQDDLVTGPSTTIRLE